MKKLRVKEPKVHTQGKRQNSAGREPGSPRGQSLRSWSLRWNKWLSVQPTGHRHTSEHPLCAYTSHKNSHFNLQIRSSAASSTLFYLQNCDPKLKSNSSSPSPRLLCPSNCHSTFSRDGLRHFRGTRASVVIQHLLFRGLFHLMQHPRFITIKLLLSEIKCEILTHTLWCISTGNYIPKFHYGLWNTLGRELHSLGKKTGGER